MMTLIALSLVITGPLLAQDAEEGSTAAEVEAVEEAPAEEEAEDTPALLRDEVNALWTCLAAFLVFFMQAGFALVEAGFTRAKNACNIIMKNLLDLSVGSLSFWMIGFGLMFGASNGWFITDTSFFFFDGSSDAALELSSEPFNWAFLIFQTVFCATAATIVSGAVAERTKFTGYIAYSILICVIVYPIFGSWGWGSLYAGEGWLEKMGFYDFAGSTVVHSIGGWAALAGAIVIGPRIGKYTKDGNVKPIPGHNIPLAALGVFILWLGWFGFNAGSTTSVDGGGFAFIAVTTNLAAAAGSVGALITSWILFKKPDPSFALNGALAGLVSITAGCDAMSPAFASLAGLLGGVLVVFSVVFFDKLKIDDPVGAISVHGVCGAWGTLAVGLFMTDGGLLTGGGAGQLITQLTGVGAGFIWAFGTSMIIFLGIKYTIGLRVSAEEEMEGLDITEHGMYAYPPHLVSESTSTGKAG
ncbi:MAG: ammonium transporter [Pirellulaceae bacterium]